MKRGIIITLPNFDDATTYLTYYSKHIIKKAESENIKIKEISDKELRNINFSKILTKLGYSMIIFNGHGSSDSIFGYKKKVLVKVGKNEEILKERIVYARACHAGSNLGPKCMENTKKGCFIGYKLPFVFFMDEKWSTKPSNDNVAKLFLFPSNLIPISLIKGNCTLDAHNNSKKQILKNIEKLLKKTFEPGVPHLLEGLWNNYVGQDIFGNKNAKL